MRLLSFLCTADAAQYFNNHHYRGRLRYRGLYRMVQP